MRTSEFNDAVDQLSRAQDEGAFRRVIETARRMNAAPREIARLAAVLADSGERLRFPADSLVADIPSTGGPSSLSTLLCPLYLVALGARVPKLGIPGRPAGGIDALAQIPGYRINLVRQSIYEILARGSYAHFLAGAAFTPADMSLFRFRQKTGAQDAAVLVIASILSKKLAVNISHVGLDIRVLSKGNFGATWDEARRNARLFNATATELGIKSACFLTDGELPYQEHLGRRESLVGLHKLFCRNAGAALERHDKECAEMAALTVGKVADINRVRKQLRGIFFSNVEAQGGDEEGYLSVVDETEKQHVNEIVVNSKGLLAFSTTEIRDLLVGYQRKASTRCNEFPDPCGVILLRNPGDLIGPSDVVATYRADSQIREAFGGQLRALFSIGEQRRKRLPFEVVEDA